MATNNGMHGMNQATTMATRGTFTVYGAQGNDKLLLAQMLETAGMTLTVKCMAPEGTEYGLIVQVTLKGKALEAVIALTCARFAFDGWDDNRGQSELFNPNPCREEEGTVCFRADGGAGTLVLLFNSEANRLGLVHIADPSIDPDDIPVNQLWERALPTAPEGNWQQFRTGDLPHDDDVFILETDTGLWLKIVLPDGTPVTQFVPGATATEIATPDWAEDKNLVGIWLAYTGAGGPHPANKVPFDKSTRMLVVWNCVVIFMRTMETDGSWAGATCLWHEDFGHEFQSLG